MTIVHTRDLLSAALAQNVGVGAFNVLHLETAQGIAAAAEQTGLPVIMQISQNCVAFHRGLDAIAAATLAVARASSAPIAIHLDHAEDPNLVRHAIDLGLSSVMFDGAHLPYAENVALTAELAAYARDRNVLIEAELGVIGGKDGAHAPGVRTDPEEAASFVAATGVDTLAVAVGSSHAMTERVASLDLALIARLKSAVPVPLVLHGSSGVPDDTLREAVAAGMTKVNVSTQLNRFFTDAVRDYLDSNPSVVDSRKYIAAGRVALSVEAARMLQLIALVRP